MTGTPLTFPGMDTAPVLGADGFPKLPGRSVMGKLWRDVERLVDLCDHPYDLPRDGSIHMTSTRGFHAPGPDGKPRAVGLSTLTCPDCRPLVEKAVDAATGGHDDEPWPRRRA